MSPFRLLIILLPVLTSFESFSQTDSTFPLSSKVTAKYLKQVNSKVEKYSDRLTRKTEKTLVKLSKWENKIHRLLLKADPATANRLFAPGTPTFSSLLQEIKDGKNNINNYAFSYNDYSDKLTTGLSYMEEHKALIDSNAVLALAKTTSNNKELQKQISFSESTEKFIKERRKQLINESIKYIGKSKYLQKINKESFYYAETLKNYKEIFSDPKKTEEAVIKGLNNIPAFKTFMQENSMLASLFGKPSQAGSAQSLVGLQTRAGMNAIIADKMGSGGPNAQQIFAANIQSAQSELSQLKAKMNKAGSSDTELPDFKPNMQKSKTFLQRLEYGANVQFSKGNSLLPSSTDIAGTIGYKINDKSTAGVGVAYKMGMGSINRIRISHEGIGLRSFIDWKLKKQFYVSGGYEWNYFSAFKSISDLKSGDSKYSGLVGLTKKIINGKFKGNMQVLFDVLSQTKSPITQPFIFRTGYSF